MQTNSVLFTSYPHLKSDRTIAAAFDPTIINDAGAYLDDSVPHNDLLPDYAKSEADAVRLWELSEQLWGQKFVQ